MLERNLNWLPMILDAYVATISESIRLTQKTLSTSCKRTAAMEFSPEERVLQIDGEMSESYSCACISNIC